MSIIRLPLLYAGSKDEKLFDTLFDETISLSRINSSTSNQIELPKRLGRPRAINAGKNGAAISIEYAVCLDFYINGILLSDEFLVIPEQNEEIIIGGATIRKWRIKLNFGNNPVYVDPKVATHQLI